MKHQLNKLLEKFGYRIVPFNSGVFNDMDQDFKEVFELVKPYTMVSVERLYSLYLTMKYVLENNIKGDIVECGVWKGGCAMLMAYMLKKYKSNKNLYLYDTYEGMPEPKIMDAKVSTGEKAIKVFNREVKKFGRMIAISLEEVKRNMNIVDYKNVIYIKGMVEHTIPVVIPKKIAILRLDTDWYDSTKHELKYLYPLLSVKGVLLLDDYGFWSGCRKAVDDYFYKSKPLFIRDDFSGRVMIKLGRLK